MWKACVAEKCEGFKIQELSWMKKENARWGVCTRCKRNTYPLFGELKQRPMEERKWHYGLCLHRSGGLI